MQELFEKSCPRRLEQRNTFTAGSSVCTPQREMEIELWVAGTSGKRLGSANSLQNRTQTCWHQPRGWTRWILRHSRSQRLRRGSETLAHLDCDGTRAQGFLSPGSLLRGSELELFPCYSTVNKCLYGKRHPSLCYGKPGVTSQETWADPVRMCKNQGGNCQVTEVAITMKGDGLSPSCDSPW